MKRIPLSLLSGACAEQLSLVQREWPGGIPVTEAAASRAVALGLDLGWLANKLLPAPALAEYERARAPARAECERVTAPALAEYERVTSPARAEYERATTAALVRLVAEFTQGLEEAESPQLDGVKSCA